MTAITMEVGGTTRSITDIAPYRIDLAATGRKLAAIYAAFDPTFPEGLAPRESEIVDLVNRYQELKEIIDRWEAAEQRDANILAGWALVEDMASGDMA